MTHGNHQTTPAASTASRAKVTKLMSAELSRARRLVYGLRSESAVLEAQRFRTAAGARFALAIERGFLARSSVIAALERRFADLATAAEAAPSWMRLAAQRLVAHPPGEVRAMLETGRAIGGCWDAEFLSIARDMAAALERTETVAIIEREMQLREDASKC